MDSVGFTATVRSGLRAAKERRGMDQRSPKDASYARNCAEANPRARNGRRWPAAGLEEEREDLLFGGSSARFPWQAFSWNIGDAHGAAARSEMHRIIGNGEATDGGALDTEDADELDGRCYLDGRWGMGKNVDSMVSLTRWFAEDWMINGSKLMYPRCM
uniref:Uncharacterized protein n=1 Tax=Oryza glaberrima TaxID=4538 RepID=I1QAM4_ORYGL